MNLVQGYKAQRIRINWIWRQQSTSGLTRNHGFVIKCQAIKWYTNWGKTDWSWQRWIVTHCLIISDGCIVCVHCQSSNVNWTVKPQSPDSTTTSHLTDSDNENKIKDRYCIDIYSLLYWLSWWVTSDWLTQWVTEPPSVIETRSNPLSHGVSVKVKQELEMGLTRQFNFKTHAISE